MHKDLHKSLNRWKSSTWVVLLCIYARCIKTISPNPTPDPPVGTIFAGKKLVFSTLLCISIICIIKTIKPLKYKHFVYYASLYASIMQSLCKLAHLQKICNNNSSILQKHRKWELFAVVNSFASENCLQDKEFRIF